MGDTDLHTDSLIDGNSSRIVAGIVLLLSILFLITGHWLIPAFLFIDFFQRGLDSGGGSLLSRLSIKIDSWLNLSNRTADSASKRFASQLGFILADLIFIFAIVGLSKPAFYLMLVLTIFSFLEAAFSFCVGCKAYIIFNRLSKYSPAVVS